MSVAELLKQTKLVDVFTAPSKVRCSVLPEGL